MKKVVIGDCTLICGDCLDVLPTLEAGSVDAVVTDPPYGIKHKSHGQIFARAKPIDGDESLKLANLIRAWAKENNLPCVMFFSPYRPMEAWRNVLCWVKGKHVGIGGDRATCWKRDFELIGIERNGKLTGKRDSAVIHCPALLPPPSGHFAEKPVELMEYLLNKINAPRIFDPCFGSGTTGVACLRTERKFIGIEKDPAYFDIAVKRIEKEYQEQQHTLFQTA